MKKIELTVEAITKAINSVANRAASLQKDIQQVAIATFEHSIAHGDPSLSALMIERITKSKGVKSAKLQMYFEAMYQATYDSKDGKFVFDEGVKPQDVNLEMCRAVNWFDFKPDPKDNSKDLGEILTALGKLLDKSVESGKVSSDTATELLAAANLVAQSQGVTAIDTAHFAGLVVTANNSAAIN